MTTDPQAVARAQSRATEDASLRCLLAALAYLGIPKSMIDLGCGSGHLVRAAAALGVGDALGVDLVIESKAGFYDPGYWQTLPWDLTNPLVLSRRELVLCLEVAEHLPSGAADTLCDTIVDCASKTLLFSAATPGQGGAGHLNEQPHSYWRGKLEKRGLVLDDDLTETLHQVWGEVAPGAWWYGKNIMVFHRERES